jgi:hypothetical protein
VTERRVGWLVRGDDHLFPDDRCRIDAAIGKLRKS